MRVVVGLFTGVLAAAIAGCGGGGGGGGATCTPRDAFTLTISSSGVSPTNACVSPGGTVTFQNTDTASHHVAFTPAATCPAAVDVAAGQAGNIGFPSEVQCTYSVTGTGNTFSGTVIATTIVQSGGGY